MDLTKAMNISASGMKAQGTRLRIIAENIANSQSTAQVPGGDPYRRQIVSFKAELDKARKLAARADFGFQQASGTANLEASSDAGALSAALEQAIRQAPEQYFWMHKRWKTRPPEEPAPGPPV